ncbi:MAG TPA: hypothetical protein VNT60_00900 [Deinococcales bacterium]|nr:hypothetical protein [Deinococcales bacterium]
MFFRRRTAESGPRFLKPDGQNAFRMRVKTARRGEVVEIRMTKSGDISPDEGGYFVRKHVVGPKFYDRATVEVRFERNYANPRATVEGGEVVPLSEWE